MRKGEFVSKEYIVGESNCNTIGRNKVMIDILHEALKGEKLVLTDSKEEYKNVADCLGVKLIENNSTTGK